MGRTFEQWWNTIPKDLRDKVRKGDEGNKPLLNQINWIWVHNKMHLGRCMYRSLPNKSNLLDETNELHCWSTSSSPQERSIRKRLGRRRRTISGICSRTLFYYF